MRNAQKAAWSASWTDATSHQHSLRAFTATICLVATSLVGGLMPSAALAECKSELRILADDLAGKKLSSQQNQYIANKILMAKRHCWVMHEEAAMDLINQVRRYAGLEETTGEFDWENVPLESLEE